MKRDGGEIVMPKVCEYCGSPLEEKATFCAACGAKVSQPEQQDPQPPRTVYWQQGYQPSAPVKKKKSKGILIAVIALVVVAAAGTAGLLALFGGGKTEKMLVTASSPKVTSDLGVSVEFPSFLLEDNDSIAFEVKEAGVETAENGDYRITAYDITAGDLHELGTYIQIRIPYDGSFCVAGSDPARCVCAKYKNEETGAWEDVLYTVDAENKELVIDTDHLSAYGSFEIANEGLRNAYITEVNDYSYVDDELSLAAMREWVGTGEAGDACFKVADVYVKDMMKDVLLKSAGDTGDVMGNLYTVSQMGDFQFDSQTLAAGNEKLGKAIGRFGKIAAAANITYTIMQSDKTPEDVAGLYKDCFNFAMSFSEEAAIGISMVGVWCIDKSLNAFAAEVQSMRVATVAPVYRYFNDKFDGHSDNYKGEDKARTSMEWLDYLKKLTKATKGDEETFKIMLEAEVDSYARRWFDLPLAKQEDYAHYIQTLIKSGDKASSYWYSALSPTEKENMITAYKGELYDRLIPLMNKIKIDSASDLKKQKIEALKAVSNILNEKIRVYIHEVVPEGKSPTLYGYIVRFGDLNASAVVDDWTGKLGENGTATTYMTQIGYLLAGSPTKLKIYEPDANSDTDEPIHTVSVTFRPDGIDVPVAIGEGQWVDPYEYFGVDDIAALYPHLQKAKPVKMEVSPICYDNNGAGFVEFTNTDPFIIDLEKNAVTTYSTHYAEHPRYSSSPYTYDVTLTFVGSPYSSDLMKVSSSYIEHTSHGDEPGVIDECTIFNISAEYLRDYEKRAVVIDNGTVNTVAFVVNKVLLP